MKRLKTLPVIVAVLVFAGCASSPYDQKWSKFLRNADSQYRAWLDERIDIDINNVPLWDFRNVPGLGFERMPMQLLGRTSRCAVVSVRARGMSRRELLWKVHEDYGVVIDLVYTSNIPTIRVRSREFIRLTSP